MKWVGPWEGQPVYPGTAGFCNMCMAPIDADPEQRRVKHQHAHLDLSHGAQYSENLIEEEVH